MLIKVNNSDNVDRLGLGWLAPVKTYKKCNKLTSISAMVRYCWVYKRDSEKRKGFDRRWTEKMIDHNNGHIFSTMEWLAVFVQEPLQSMVFQTKKLVFKPNRFPLFLIEKLPTLWDKEISIFCKIYF